VLGADMAKIFSFSVDDRVAEQASYISERYAAFQLDRSFESLAYYKKIKQGGHNDKT
jgi:hypothetical protein